jgi:hydrophobic/amphiphilic exporter-1 (mainly G- bacteria), HAE1 family
MTSAGGESKDIEEAFQNLFLSIIVALALVYVILVNFFGSLLVPLVILLAVSLTTVGTFGALFLTDTTLRLPSLLGLLLLIGIVVSVGYSLLEGARQKKRKYAK